MRTQIVRPPQLHFAYDGEDGLGAQLDLMRGVAAGAGQLPLLDGWDLALQQSRPCGCPQPGNAVPEGRLHGLQIRTAGVVALGKNTRQQRTYFPRDLRMDRSSRFFP